MSITTGTFPGVRIVDMPDLGAITDNSSVVGERAGSGRFNVAQIRGYTGDNARSIKWYGARGDGATDDTAAVQAALNAGVDLHAPPGTYMVGTLNVPSGTVLTGAGRGATVFRRINNAPNDGLFSLASNANNVELTSFTLDGNRANNTHGFLLTGTNCANLFVRDVMFQNDAKTAAYFVTLNPSGGNQTALLSGCEVNACGTGGFTFSGARNLTVEDCLFTTSGAAGVFFDAVTGNTITIKDNQFIANTSHGLAITCVVSGSPVVLTWPITDVVVSGNHAEGNGGYGLLVQAEQVSVTGNVSISNGLNGGGLGLSGLLINCDRVNVTGNTSLSNNGDGLDMGGSSRFVVSGNVCADNNYYGIEVDACYQGSVSGNMVSGNFAANPAFTRQCGIYHGPGSGGGGTLANTCDRVTFAGNSVAIGPNQNYGIYVDSTATNCVVVGNDLITSGNIDDLFIASTVAVASDNLTRWIGGNPASPLASAASVTLPDGSDLFEVSGTATINALVSSAARKGRRVSLFFQNALTLAYNVGANGFVLAGSVNLSVTATSCVSFVQRFDGKWYETGRTIH